MNTGTIVIAILGIIMAWILLAARKEAKVIEPTKKEAREERRRKKKYGF